MTYLRNLNVERGIETLKICLTEDLLDRLAQAEYDDNVQGMVAGHHPSFTKSQILSVSIEPAEEDLGVHKECRYQLIIKVRRGPEVLAEWILEELDRGCQFIAPSFDHNLEKHFICATGDSGDLILEEDAFPR